MKQTLTAELTLFMKYLETEGHNISKMLSQEILLKYYENYHGVNNNTTVRTFLDITPRFGSVTRAIRKARELNPLWKKEPKQKQKEIDNTKDEVGY